MPLPRHIAIIPDGNRRWAKAKGLPAFFGHREGAKAAEKIFAKALELKIPYLTMWGLSMNNLKRPADEVEFLMNLFELEFKRLANSKDVHQNRIRIRALGRWQEHFSPGAKAAIQEMIDKTATYDALNLTFLLAYNGTEEMVSAVREVTRAYSNTPLPDGQTDSITEQTIKNHLYTKELPPVDLVIRTGGDPHLSTGFMMWDVAEAQLYFSDLFWPDFSPEAFEEAMAAYGQAERRHGK